MEKEFKDKWIKVTKVYKREDIHWLHQDKTMTDMVALVEYTYKKKDRQINNNNPIFAKWEKAIYKNNKGMYIKIGQEKIYIDVSKIVAIDFMLIRGGIKKFENFKTVSFGVGSVDGRYFSEYLKFMGYRDDIDYKVKYTVSSFESMGNREITKIK